MEYPIPENDGERVALIENLQVLDTDPESRFDRLTELAKDIFQVEISLVSIVDRDRQWFKSKVGTDVCETDRSLSFCSHAVYNKALLNVSNALEDDRFKNNPLVVDEPRIRAYLGIPLQIVPGHYAGTLCVIDTRPRTFSEREIRILKTLAKQAEAELTNFERNRQWKELQERNSQLHEKEAQLLAAVARADHANNAKSNFLAVMSHEIRTPLNGIIGFLTELKFTANSPEQNDFIKLALESGELLLSILDDVLDFSKIEAGALDLEMSDVPLRDLFHYVNAHFEIRAKQAGLEWHAKMQKDLEKQSLNTEDKRLKQILFNLLSNAVKFTPSGEIRFTVFTEQNSHDEKTRIVFQVEDTGIGIPREKFHRLFKPFSQTDPSTSRKFGGSGLGLAISKKLTQMLQGDIVLTSEVGKGSCFKVVLPARLKTITSFDSIETVQSCLHPSIASKRILAAEDNPVNSQLLKAVAKRIGINITVVENGKSCLDRAISESWDLIFMDVEMPLMDGFETTRKIRNTIPDERKLPIVAMTAYTGQEYLNRCIEAGMQAVMTKPYKAQEICTILNRFLAEQ